MPDPVTAYAILIGIGLVGAFFGYLLRRK